MTLIQRQWLTDVALALAFTLLAAGLRAQGYPLCPGDEAAWLQIAHALQQGRMWPVSGPGYVMGVQSLGALSGQTTVQAIPDWGVMSVFCVVLVLLRLYRQLLPMRPWLALAALALSSYFWAPLLESRPQQWGQLLVFLGSGLCWLWLQAPKPAAWSEPAKASGSGWAGAGLLLVLPLTAWAHILSHAVLLWVCVLLLLGQRMLAPTHMCWRRHASVWGLLLFSAGIYLLPQGPYAAMLQDIERNHLVNMNGLVLLGFVIQGIAILSFLYWRKQWHTPKIVVFLLQFTERHARLCQSMLFAALLLLLSSQALLLPPEAWRPYGGSPTRFVVFQLGNVALALCLIAGAVTCLRAPSLPWPAMWSPFLLISLLAMTLLAGLSMLASMWLLHTNWLLRLINYGLLFAAPIAAVGLLHLSRSWPRWTSTTLVGAGMVLSLLAVLRPTPLLAC